MRASVYAPLSIQSDHVASETPAGQIPTEQALHPGLRCLTQLRGSDPHPLHHPHSLQLQNVHDNQGVGEELVHQLQHPLQEPQGGGGAQTSASADSGRLCQSSDG